MRLHSCNWLEWFKSCKPRREWIRPVCEANVHAQWITGLAVPGEVKLTGVRKGVALFTGESGDFRCDKNNKRRTLSADSANNWKKIPYWKEWPCFSALTLTPSHKGLSQTKWAEVTFNFTEPTVVQWCISYRLYNMAIICSPSLRKSVCEISGMAAAPDRNGDLQRSNLSRRSGLTECVFVTSWPLLGALPLQGGRPRLQILFDFQ